MEKETQLIFYKDWYELKSICSPERYYAFLDAIMDYAFSGVEAVDPNIHDVFHLAKLQIDRDRAKYSNICKKRREAIQKRYKKKEITNEYNSIQLNTNVTNNNDNDIDTDIDNDTDKDIDRDNDNDSSKPKGYREMVLDNNYAPSPPPTSSKKRKEKEIALTNELLSDKEKAYWEDVAMGLYAAELGWDIPGIKRMLGPFQDGNAAKQKWHEDLTDLKRHFYDWLTIQANHARKNKTKDNRDNGKYDKSGLIL